MDPFKHLAEILSFAGISNGSRSKRKNIRNGLATFSNKHLELTRLLAKTLKETARIKRKLFVLKESLREKEDEEWVNQKRVWKGENQDHRRAIVRDATKKHRRKIALLESKVETLEALRSAIYAGLKTLEQGRDSISRQLSVLDLEERIDR